MPDAAYERGEYQVGDAWPPRDRFDRIQPHGLTWVTYFRAMPWLAKAFERKVPDEFISFDTEEDGTEVVVIACPCGETPRVRLTTCHECKCERFYLATKASVRVANSPQDRKRRRREAVTGGGENLIVD